MPGSPRLAAATAAVLLALPAAAPAQVSVADVLRPDFQPTVAGGPGVNIETPPESAWAKCSVEEARDGNAAGYVLIGPQGQTLRRLLDANRDGSINLFIYYDQGMEVYREWDDDGPEKNAAGENTIRNNNFRWVNLGGTRWGVDTNGDSRIDEWKRISAQEAGRVAAEAVLNNDPAMLETVLATPADLEAIGVNRLIVDDIAAGLSMPANKLNELRSGSKLLAGRGEYQQFNSGQPGLILPGENRATRELELVENSTALVSTGARETGMISVGEMVKLPAGTRPGQAGEVWKLTAMPLPIEGSGTQIVLGGPLMQPAAGLALGAENSAGLSEEVANLLKDLGKLMEDQPGEGASDDDRRKFASRQLQIYKKLFAEDATEDRGVWLVQQADLLNLLFQNDLIPDGFTRTELEKLADTARADAKKAEPTIEQRRLFVEFAARRKAIVPADGGNIPQADSDKFNEWWTGAREQFVNSYDDAGEAAGFLLDLGIEAEQDKDKTKASGYYRTLAQKFDDTPPGQKATGALRRLNLVGKPLEFSVPLLAGGTATAADYDGKVLLMTFWTTDCDPCTENLPVLKDLRDRFGRSGFEILAVNLDRSPNPIEGYLERYKVDFPIGYEPGAFEGRTAMQFGVVNLPTMIVADRQGRVVGTDLDAREVRRKVEALMK